jgi:hypothetical protein
MKASISPIAKYASCHSNWLFKLKKSCVATMGHFAHLLTGFAEPAGFPPNMSRESKHIYKTLTGKKIAELFIVKI